MRKAGVLPRSACRRGDIVVAVFLATALSAARIVRAEDPPPNPPSAPPLAERLEPLHKAARAARASKDYVEVERLRLERREAIAKSSGSSDWKQGLVAIEKANQAVARMQYTRACELLEAAWEPFESMSARQAVFGDVALELFLANEAARMVDPKEAPVAVEKIRECLARAAADDPCQVEVAAALAFLTPPNTDEAMRRLDDRRSVRERNERLLAIQRPAAGGSVILPWHAPVEHLLAKSSSFVLGDLDYLRGFLRPDERLEGVNRHGESWSLALGGGILVATTERRSEGVRSVFKLDSYDTTAKSWRQFAPEVIVVSSAVSGPTPGEWQLGAADVQKRIKDLSGVFDTAWSRRADERLMAIADAMGRPDVTVGVQKIRQGTWRGNPDDPKKPPDPPPGSPIDKILEKVAAEFVNLSKTATRQPDVAAAARAAKEVTDVLEEYRRCMMLKDRSQDFFGPATKMTVSELSTLRNFVDQVEFAEPAQAEPPRRGAPAGLDGFGAAPAPAASSPPGFQLKAQLLDALMQAEFLAACRAFQEDDAGFKYLAGFNVEVYIAGENAMPGPQRTAALQLKEAVRRLGELFGQLCGGKDANGKDLEPKPLKLVEFQALHRQLGCAFESCVQLEGDETKVLALAFRLTPLLKAFNAVVAPVAAREELQQTVKTMRRVRSWRIGAVDWNFYDLEGMSVSNAADVIEEFRPLIVAEDDLDAVSKHLGGGGTSPPAPSLRPGSWLARTPFIDANGRLNLRLQPSDRPALVVALVERTGRQADQGPQAFPDAAGRPTLKVNDGAESLVMRLDLDAGEMVVDYPGLEGHIPIGIVAEPEKVTRYLKDRRGYRITAAAADGPLLFEMVAANGEKISAGYHSIVDLVGIDRNIVNSFLPATLLCGPSLPAWQAYRGQLLRWSPDARRVRWAVPRPGYRVNE